MPTYRAGGVTARLVVANLKDTLSSAESSRVKDDDRLRTAFDSGTALQERPICEDGNDNGVMQFIGEHGDMPFFMAEAGECVHGSHGLVGVMPTIELSGNANPNTNMPGGITTSEPHTNQSNALHTPLIDPSTSDTPSAISITYAKTAVQCGSTSSPARFNPHPSVDPLAETQAMRLIVDTNVRAYTTRRFRKSTEVDLKIEVFYNGHLSDTKLTNTRATGPDNVCSWQGTRISSVVEKPWVYQLATNLENREDGAEQRWKAIQEVLTQEAEDRGCDTYGRRSTSAEFLLALAELPLPDRLRNKAHLGVIDLLVVTGKGSKYGPTYRFLTKPVRISDKRYKVTQTHAANEGDSVVLAGDIAADERALPDTSDQTLSLQYLGLPSPAEEVSMKAKLRKTSKPKDQLSASSEKPLSKLSRKKDAGHHVPTPTKAMSAKIQRQKEYNAFAEELGIHLDDEVTLQTVMGKISLQQRLGYFRQMTASNRKIKADKLNEDIKKFKAQRKPVDSVEPDSFDRSFSELENSGFTSDLPMDDAETEEPGQQPGTDGPGSIQIDRRASAPQTLGDAVAILAQKRAGIAIDLGAAPDGRLVNKIAYTSSHLPPTTKTPPDVPVPNNEQFGPLEVVPEARDGLRAAAGDEENAATTDQPQENAMPPTERRDSVEEALPRRKVGPPANATTHDIDAHFTVPQTCQGSAAAYAGRGEWRHVNKVRPGEFEEEELVVGMRFVIV